MTIYLGKSCSFCLPRVPFVNCRQFMYLVISLLVLRAGYGIWLYQFLIIAYLFTLVIIYSYFLPVWGIVKTAATGCRGQFDALLPEAERRGQWCNELSAVPRGSRFVYSAKQPWNNVYFPTNAETPSVLPRNASLTGTRLRYTQLTSWCSTSFSWCLTSSTRQ